MRTTGWLRLSALAVLLAPPSAGAQVDAMGHRIPALRAALDRGDEATIRAQLRGAIAEFRPGLWPGEWGSVVVDPNTDYLLESVIAVIERNDHETLHGYSCAGPELLPLLEHFAARGTTSTTLFR